MKLFSKDSLLKSTLLTGILSVGIAGTSLLSTSPAVAAPRCTGHYETRKVFVPGHEQAKRWIPARWANENGHRRYYAGHWEDGGRDQGHYVTQRVWVNNCARR